MIKARIWALKLCHKLRTWLRREGNDTWLTILSIGKAGRRRLGARSGTLGVRVLHMLQALVIRFVTLKLNYGR